MSPQLGRNARLERIGAVFDPRSFRRFVGLGLDEGQPDHATLSRFRQAQRERGLDTCRFDEVERQLGARGLLVKSETLLDATLVEAAVRRPGRPTGSGSAVDPDAAWTRQADKAYEHKDRRRRLKAAGIKDRIMPRSHQHQARLPHWQAVRNILLSPIRSAVERVFGICKRSYGYRRVRYRGLNPCR